MLSHASVTRRRVNSQQTFASGRAMRAYNSKFDMIDAEIVDRSEPETVIEKFFENPETAFVDVRSVTRGCYTFRIQRA
jgi:hypothetical protein